MYKKTKNEKTIEQVFNTYGRDKLALETLHGELWETKSKIRGWLRYSAIFHCEGEEVTYNPRGIDYTPLHLREGAAVDGSSVLSEYIFSLETAAAFSYTDYVLLCEERSTVEYDDILEMEITNEVEPIGLTGNKLYTVKSQICKKYYFQIPYNK